MAHDKIIIKGARENNLKNINVEIPRDALVVLTGVSGSGKSSLAFETIYAEGQRRYMESLSSYARQFLGQMEKPDVDSIEGLSPAISIDQKTTNHNPRSTVGTVTEIYDYLRLLFARVGTPHCPTCGKEIKRQTVDQITDQIMEMPKDTRLQILAPVVRARKGEHTKLIEDAARSGYARARVDGIVYELTEEIKLEKNKKHNIEIVVDRLIVKPGIGKRLSESCEAAMALAEGLLIVNDGEADTLFSQNFSCPDCGFSLGDIEPRLFSFNNPQGACPDCTGLGFCQKFDEDLIISNPSKPLRGGAIRAMGFDSSANPDSWMGNILMGLADKLGFDLDLPYCELPENVKETIMRGAGDLTFPVKWTDPSGYSRTYDYKFAGVIPILERRYKETSSDYMKAQYEELIVNAPCKTCGGKRLKPEVLSVTFDGMNIFDMTNMPVTQAIEKMKGAALTKTQMLIAERIMKEINERLRFLSDVGLGYLTLSRSASTLSGGESQRIRLATQIGSGLVGVVYILDEPSIGLHQRDNDKLLATLKRLRDLGNTLIVVEHDEDTMRAADWLVDIGPKAGGHGGEVVFSGKVCDIVSCEESITGEYLCGAKAIALPKARRQGGGAFLTIKGAGENNLKNIDVSIPIGLFTCVTGVSGSGKSSLVNEIIYKRLARDLNRARTKPGKHAAITGIENLDKIIDIDQSPIGRTPRSNPATYSGLFDLVRDVFSETTEAKVRGYKKGRFSFNVRGGRCEACGGDGINKIEMHFLPDVYVPCEVCGGKRYNRETLDVRYKGKNIAEVLDMTVEDALAFFENLPRLATKVQALFDVGLGYVKLGQPSTQLSGGEAQRVKLATELSKRATGRTIYVLDEPTTGLHSDDVRKLIDILQMLVDNGNTVVVIEHNLDVIKTADYIIDLGPEGGDAGGAVVAAGTPEEVARCKKSFTGRYLKKKLA